MRYAKVDLRLWHDSRFRGFGPPAANAQFLFLYLLTSPAKTLIPGVLRERFSTVFQQFGWSERAGLAQVAALAEVGMISFEDDLIWLPNALSHNRPSNPNVVRGWRKAYDAELPECGLRELIGAGITAFLRDFPPAFRAAFHARAKAKAQPPRPGPKGSPNGSTNGSVNGSENPARTHRRINSNSNRSVRTPAADAAGTRAPDFWRVLRLAQQHRDALLAEPTDGDRMDALKTLCAQHGVGYDGNLVGRVLSDARVARHLRRA